MNLAEINRMMAELKGWSLEGNSIVKELEFKDFKDSLNFMNKVGDVSEEMGHHPTVLLNYNRIRITLTSYEAGGLTEKDFELAAKIDKVNITESK